MRLIPILAILLLVGCATVKTLDNVGLTNDSIIRAQAKVKVVIPRVDKPNAEILQSASTDLDDATKANQATQAQLIAQEKRYQDELASIPSRIGHFLWKWFWIVIGSWAVIGIGGAVLTATTGGAPFAVGRFLLNLLPASNAFSFASKFIESKLSPVASATSTAAEKTVTAVRKGKK